MSAIRAVGDLTIGDVFTLAEYPDERFTVQEFRAEGVLVDVQSDRRAEEFCFPVRYLREHARAMGIEAKS